MLLFVIMLLAPIAIQHIGTTEETYQKKNRQAISVFFLILTFLIACRHDTIGKDTTNYIYFFENFAKVGWEKLPTIPVEIGFSTFNKIVALFSTDPRFFLVVMAIFVSILLFPTYRRLCIDPSLTIVLFCVMSTFVMMFSGIRQMMAVGIGFIAYHFTRKRNIVLFLLFAVLAMTVHASAFMLLLMYPLYHAKITRKWLLAIVPMLVILFVFNEQVFAILSLLVAQFTKYDGEISSTGAYTMLILLAIFAVFAFLIPDENRVDEETNGLRNFLLLAVVVQMFAPLHMLAMRMGYYYIIFIPLLLPKIIAVRSERWSEVAVAGRHIMLVFFLIYFVMGMYTGSALNVFPYHFFWENGV